MKSFSTAFGRKMLFPILASLLAGQTTFAQNGWPRSIIGADGGILYVYQPQADSFAGNTLRFKAPVSYMEKGSDAPRYGSFQALATVNIDKDERVVSVLLANVLFLSISGPSDSAKLEYLKETLECGIPAATIDMPLDELVSSLSLQTPSMDRQFADLYGHIPPRLIFANQPSVLVLIDGPPRLQRHPVWGINHVVNSPYTILESEDGWFYLYGGHQWYLGPSAGGPFHNTGYIAPDIRRTFDFILQSQPAGFEHTDTLREGAGTVMDIIVSPSPAELVQTHGKPAFQPIPGTTLQFVSNTNSDLLLDTARHQFYLLLSGRWYTAPSFDATWQYISSDALPADFKRIPEGSPKDNVLASIAGTDAAREAIADALLPQTAVIPVSASAAPIAYDGPPQFADIPGTRLQYALNTSAAVLKEKNAYYCVDRGVWFTSDKPAGPWKAATERPQDMNFIPPSCPLYYCKYVFIFGSSPQYIYTGYTSGYLNFFIDGPTLIYGTGNNYPVWYGKSSFRKPFTWGFGMSYNPWFGWCLGDDLDPSWFDGDLDTDNQWYGGMWGPASFRPPYLWHHFSGHGLYQQDIGRVQNIAYSNDIYNQRSDRIVPAAIPVFYTDTIGDIFKRSEKDQWLRYIDRKWEKVVINKEISTLNVLEKQRKRAQMRLRNFIRQRGG